MSLFQGSSPALSVISVFYRECTWILCLAYGEVHKISYIKQCGDSAFGDIYRIYSVQEYVSCYIMGRYNNITEITEKKCSSIYHMIYPSEHDIIDIYFYMISSQVGKDVYTKSLNDTIHIIIYKKNVI